MHLLLLAAPLRKLPLLMQPYCTPLLQFVNSFEPIILRIFTLFLRIYVRVFVALRERLSMQSGMIGRKLGAIRERRMWTQARLAEEAGVSPTTVSGIESGRISRPHFGTLRKLARALGVEAEELVTASSSDEGDVSSPLSLEWAMSSGEEEFERGLEGASIEGLNSLFHELGEEQGRLRRLYGEARGGEQRRLIKSMIRQVAANSGSVEASLTAQNYKHPEHSPERRSPQDENPERQEPSV
jgi:transcriptional regulator with XRE-family HTH domain